MNMYKFLRPLLWMFDAERAHDLALSALGRASASQSVRNSLRRIYSEKTPALAVEAFGLSFPNCIGLAAGMDKNGRGLPAFAALGFGFLEVGTVTPRPQAGNPKPRMWRLPNQSALINRLGFNNEGATAVRERLSVTAPLLNVPLGVNIGKNAATPLENALDDYRTCLRELHPWADYIVINISSPNTPELRSLQHAAALDELLSAMRQDIDGLSPRESGHVDEQDDRAGTGDRARPEDSAETGDAHIDDRASRRTLPLLVKLAPDLTAADLDDIAEACLRHRIDGIIATNTTISRDGIGGPHADEAGGLSGAPLTDMSNRIVAALHRRVGARIPIVGVGGIMNADDAYAKIKAGATLVQVLTGFVYEGPSFPRNICTGLETLLARDGFARVRDAVGIEASQYAEPSAFRSPV